LGKNSQTHDLLSKLAQKGWETTRHDLESNKDLTQAEYAHKF